MINSLRYCLILPVLFLFSVSTAAAENYRFYKLTLENGLSSNSVYRIEQDSTGYMWFGTFSGLGRYDGREVRTYKPEPGVPGSISSPVIFDLHEDSKGRLWVGTDGGGLNLYNRDSDDFTLFSHDAGDRTSVSSNNVYAICEDSSGRLWFGTGGAGLNLFNEEERNFRIFRASDGGQTLDSDVIRSLLCDSEGRLWVGTQGGGLAFMEEEGRFVNFRHDKSDSLSISSDNVRTILEDSAGHLWIGTEGGGLNLFNRGAGTFGVVANPELEDPLHYSVRSIREDRDGHLWIGTEGQGIFIIDREGNILSSIRHEKGNSDSLSKDKIRHIFIDRNGLVWIGTRDGGVNRFNPRTIGFTNREIENVRALYEDSEKRIWIGSDGGGLYSLSEKGVIEKNRALLSNDQVYALLEDSAGNLWVGTDGGGLNRIDGETGEVDTFLYEPDNPDSLGSNTVWSLLEDSTRTLWIGTEGGGLNAWNTRTGSFSRYISIPEENSTLNGNSIRCIYEDKDRVLWVGTWDGGLNRYNRESGTFVRYSRDPLRALSLSDSSVNTIFEDSKRRLWIGTAAGGLNLMNREDETFTHYTGNEGLAGDNIFSILEDGDGYLWISTDRGLTRFNPDTGDTLNFGESDGLPGNEFSINASVFLHSGEMVFGGPRGINRFFPRKVEVNRSIPPVVITDVQVMNESLTIGSEKPLVLPHGDSILAFHFAVLDFAAPERNRYAVLMEGLQKEWTSLENQNSMVYNNLPPGDYIFRVKGADNNGIWNDEGASLPVTVLPPWWKTPLFFIILLASVALAVYLIVRSRLNRLEEKNRELREYSIHIQDVREEERTWVAREVHDQLGQTLSALKMEIYRNGSEQRDSMLGLVNMSLESVKDLSTRLRPKVLDNLCTGEAVSWLVRDFSSHTGITINRDIEERMVVENEEIKTALFRICQEVLTNVIRHSGADSVNVYLAVRGESAILKIADNGCGIAEEALEKTRSFGIRGIKERCRYLNGQCRISVNEKGGTTVRVSIPMKRKGEN
ncbi:ligand-binding sensor domain-containing protein [Spirochaeta isovalerica]|uniref:Ligand-binding sensor domain-containing protein/signal transduction histidine kinase n=1 Tax=Spirochaeta isovalerica TaxID=150 RepID=A0A841RCT9_9SPIO|nr:sensor histidine kinase [Spirochaeta isovalerica]MBB6480212.1 ligand-binding sensor domain-containing protein/signal transduction histidine kinase [Spirochaeta isovalerica]